MTTTKRVLIVFFGLFIVIQVIRLEKSNPLTNPDDEIKVDLKVKTVLKTSCFDCHSNNTAWPWYSNVAPISWLTVGDVNDGRKWLNFSEWENYDQAKKAKLKRLIFREVADAMPPFVYCVMHQNATLNETDKKILRDWTGIDPRDVSTRD